MVWLLICGLQTTEPGSLKVGPFPIQAGYGGRHQDSPNEEGVGPGDEGVDWQCRRPVGRCACWAWRPGHGYRGEQKPMFDGMWHPEKHLMTMVGTSKLTT